MRAGVALHQPRLLFGVELLGEAGGREGHTGLTVERQVRVALRRRARGRVRCGRWGPEGRVGTGGRGEGARKVWLGLRRSSDGMARVVFAAALLH
jgi:hypothetical protein